MDTLLLTQDWDITADGAGNIATASSAAPVEIDERPAYALAQDAASAMKLFAAELWYDTTQGIPYFTQILGQRPPMSLVKAYLVAAAKTVPGIVKAVCYISTFTNRGVSGQVQITDANGDTATAAF
jgi:hypothetical protein